MHFTTPESFMFASVECGRCEKERRENTDAGKVVGLSRMEEIFCGEIGVTGKGS